MPPLQQPVQNLHPHKALKILAVAGAFSIIFIVGLCAYRAWQISSVYVVAGAASEDSQSLEVSFTGFPIRKDIQCVFLYSIGLPPRSCVLAPDDFVLQGGLAEKGIELEPSSVAQEHNIDSTQPYSLFLLLKSPVGSQGVDDKETFIALRGARENSEQKAKVWIEYMKTGDAAHGYLTVPSISIKSNGADPKIVRPNESIVFSLSTSRAIKLDQASIALEVTELGAEESVPLQILGDPVWVRTGQTEYQATIPISKNNTEGPVTFQLYNLMDSEQMGMEENFATTTTDGSSVSFKK